MIGDLVVLTPDKDIEQSLRGLLAHPQKLGVRPIRDIKWLGPHPNRDPGIFSKGHESVAGLAGDYQHALLVLDLAWQGRPTSDPFTMAQQVEARCRPRWGDRARCVVIDPEVEVWVWSDSPHVATALGWSNTIELRNWLRDRQLWADGMTKPGDPKAAFESSLRQNRIPASSAIFRGLAEKVSFQRCTDASFRTLTAILREWFPKP